MYQMNIAKLLLGYGSRIWESHEFSSNDEILYRGMSKTMILKCHSIIGVGISEVDRRWTVFKPEMVQQFPCRALSKSCCLLATDALKASKIL